MSQEGDFLTRKITQFDAAGIARVLRALAASAWYLSFVVAATRFFLNFRPVFHAHRRVEQPEARHALSLIGAALGALFRTAAPVWIVFAFIWFFAAWFARVAGKRARTERLATHA